MAKKPRAEKPQDNPPEPAHQQEPTMNDTVTSADQADTTGTTTEAAEQTTAAGVSLTIQGLVFSVPRVYAPGHVLNEHEAQALDQTRRENLRNNFASRIEAKIAELKKAGATDPKVGDLNEEELRAEFQKYVDEYSFAARRTRAPVDPVLNEATKMARAQVTAALRKKEIDLKTVSAEQMQKYVDALLAKYPGITEEAKRRVDATKSISTDILAGME